MGVSQNRVPTMACVVCNRVNVDESCPGKNLDDTGSTATGAITRPLRWRLEQILREPVNDMSTSWMCLTCLNDLEQIEGYYQLLNRYKKMYRESVSKRDNRIVVSTMEEKQSMTDRSSSSSNALLSSNSGSMMKLNQHLPAPVTSIQSQEYGQAPAAVPSLGMSLSHIPTPSTSAYLKASTPTPTVALTSSCNMQPTQLSPAMTHLPHSTQSSPAMTHLQHSTQSTPAMTHHPHSTQCSPALTHLQHSTQSSPGLAHLQHSTQSTPGLAHLQHSTQSSPSLSHLPALTQPTAASSSPPTSNYEVINEHAPTHHQHGTVCTCKHQSGGREKSSPPCPPLIYYPPTTSHKLRTPPPLIDTNMGIDLSAKSKKGPPQMESFVQDLSIRKSASNTWTENGEVSAAEDLRTENNTERQQNSVYGLKYTDVYEVKESETGALCMDMGSDLQSDINAGLLRQTGTDRDSASNGICVVQGPKVCGQEYFGNDHNNNDGLATDGIFIQTSNAAYLEENTRCFQTANGTVQNATRLSGQIEPEESNFSKDMSAVPTDGVAINSMNTIRNSLTLTQRQSSPDTTDLLIGEESMEESATEINNNTAEPLEFTKKILSDHITDPEHFKPKMQEPKKEPVIETIEFTCLTCNEKFDHGNKLRQHVRIHGQENRVTCPTCRKAFANQDILNEHMKVHSDHKPFKCEVCVLSFSSLHQLKAHSSELHGGEKCDVCDMEFNEPGKLRTHREQAHSEARPFPCYVCKKAFTRPADLRAHTRTHTDDRPFMCTSCGKCFKRSDNLKMHMRIHSGEKPFKCGICEKRFLATTALKVHMRIHTGERPFPCLICGKGFRQSGALSEHIRTHTGQKAPRRCVCWQCGKAFTDNSQLKNHTMTHTGEKRFRCNICTKGFILASSLKQHMMNHSGERPHVCGVCNKGFTRQGSLVAHMRTHTGERPYYCADCGKAFREAGALKRHKRTHTGVRPYVCEVCTETFTQSHHLKEHLRVVHDIDKKGQIIMAARRMAAEKNDINNNNNGGAFDDDGGFNYMDTSSAELTGED